MQSFWNTEDEEISIMPPTTMMTGSCSTNQLSRSSRPSYTVLPLAVQSRIREPVCGSLFCVPDHIAEPPFVLLLD